MSNEFWVNGEVNKHVFCESDGLRIFLREVNKKYKLYKI